MFDDVPEQWSERSLRELAIGISRGVAPSYSSQDTSIWAVSQKCVRDGSFDLNQCRPHNEAKPVRETAYLRVGDICINSTGTGTLGRVALWRGAPRQCFADTHVTVVRADPTLADPIFLAAFLGMPSTRDTIYRDCVTGSTNQIELSKTALGQITCPVPPLNEQRRIAEVLQSSDEARKANESVAFAAEATLRAYLSEAFANAADQGQGTPLDGLLDRIIDYRGVPPPKADNGVPLITAKNVRFGFLDAEPREFVAERDYAAWMRRGIPSPGDILFTTEAPLGFVAEFPEYKAALGQRTITLVANPARIRRPYLKWLLLSPETQAVVHQHATGSTAKGIKQSTFRKLRFTVPSLSEQDEIASTCEGIWGVVQSARAAAVRLKVTRIKLAENLLSGRVRVPA